MTRWATFDCYGTLVDWNAGIAAALGDPALLGRYHDLEPAVQAEDPARSYREVLRETARRLGVDADPAASLPDWPVFDDVRPALEEARGRGWRLALLSNTDRDLIEASIRAIGVPFDLAIVASEIGSYKPAEGHWRAFEARVGRLPDVHVAQSHFHDVVTATTRASRRSGSTGWARRRTRLRRSSSRGSSDSPTPSTGSHRHAAEAAHCPPQAGPRSPQRRTSSTIVAAAAAMSCTEAHSRTEW